MKKIFLVPVLLSVFTTGCSVMSSPGYECELKVNPIGKCASMSDAYKAAGRTMGSTAKRESVFDVTQESDKAVKQASNQGYFRGQDSNFPDQSENGMPVFKQPEVHRVWVAPYVDADGNLRTGEYTYFATPGQWNYGSTNRAGQASGIFGPASAGSLGFNAVEDKKVQQPTQAPPQPAIAPNSTNQNANPNTTTDGITQPKQRF